MKILWMTGSHIEGPYVARIAQKMLDKYGLQFELTSYLEQTAQAIRAMGYACKTIKELIDETDYGGMGEDDLIQKANSILQCIDVKMLLQGDYLLMLAESSRKSLIYAAKSVIAVERFMAEGKFDGCLRYGGGSAVARAMCYIANTKGLKSFDLIQGPWYGTCDMMRNDIASEKWLWVSFMPYWESIKDKPVPEDERRALDKQLSEYFEYHKRTTKPPILEEVEGHKNLISRARALYRKLRSGDFSRPQDPMRTDLDPLVEGNMDKFVDKWTQLHYVWEDRWKKTYKGFKYDPVPKKYVYMPLVFTWDVSYMVWNYFNYIHDYYAIAAAIALPAGYELVIKEHPYFIGVVEHHELRTLQKNGVRVAHPSLNSQDLVEGASAIISMGETTGWEAIMHKKPLIVIGKPTFYCVHPAAKVVGDMNDLPEVLRQTLLAGSSAYADENAWYAVLKATYSSTTKANIWAFKTSKFWAQQDDSEKNVEEIADMIVRVGKFL